MDILKALREGRRPMIGNGIEASSSQSEEALSPFPPTLESVSTPVGSIIPSAPIPSYPEIDNLNINTSVHTNLSQPPSSSAPPAAPTNQIQTQRVSTSLDTDAKIKDIIEITYFAKAALHDNGLSTSTTHFHIITHLGDSPNYSFYLQ